MSKTNLRKTISTFSQEQLIEMILAIYSSRKDAKEFFDFYLDPDVGRLFEKYSKAIDKEFSRTKRGRMAAVRVSKIKKFVKEFASFSPGEKYVLNLYIHACKCIPRVIGIYYCSESLENSLAGLIGITLEYANKNALFSYGAESVVRLLSSFPHTYSFKKKIDSISDTYGLDLA